MTILTLAACNVNGICPACRNGWSGHPVVLAGDYNVVPSDGDI